MIFLWWWNGAIRWRISQFKEHLQIYIYLIFYIKTMCIIIDIRNNVYKMEDFIMDFDYLHRH